MSNDVNEIRTYLKAEIGSAFTSGTPLPGTLAGLFCTFNWLALKTERYGGARSPGDSRLIEGLRSHPVRRAAGAFIGVTP